MITRRQQIEERVARRDAMAVRIATALERNGIRTEELGTNTFVVVDLAGEQFTVTVSRRRRQE